MTYNRSSSFLFGLTTAAVLAVMTGCGTPAPAPSTASDAPSRSAVLPTSPAATAAKGGCPADKATLELALKANAPVADSIVLGSGLRDIVCFQTFAVARTTPDQVDAATVLFVYDQATAKWKAVTAGTAIDCTGKGVPAAAVAALPGCG